MNFTLWLNYCGLISMNDFKVVNSGNVKKKKKSTLLMCFGGDVYLLTYLGFLENNGNQLGFKKIS